jgi:benzoyl-CoA reductase/2-hydroxyglutaryl-CoA dehydratase subunit BcrC/BadD/HgdB
MTDRPDTPKRIGITTTIPVEAVFAAGAAPVDLNNVFVTSPDARRLIDHAERDGLPRNGCSWIKGIYSVATAEASGLDAVVAVTEGDCSNAAILAEILERRGVRTISFGYPPSRDPGDLRHAIDRLCRELGTTFDEAESWKPRLDAVRARLHAMDGLTWRHGTIGSEENHRWLVSSSDFGGDVDRFEAELNRAIARAEAAPENPALISPDAVRLGYVGVPPIFSDLYAFLDSLGAPVVYNEVQRQFALPDNGEGMVEAYRRYTYPYDVRGRVADIRREVKRRGLRGIVHYVQTFCHRALADTILREELDVPIITIEGHAPGPLEASARVRLESFAEMVR